MAIKDKLTAGLRNLQNNLRLAYARTLNAIGGLQEKIKGTPGGAGADAPKTTTTEMSPDTAQEIRKSTQQRDRLQEKRDTEVGLRKRLKEIDSTHNTSELDADIKSKDTQIKHLNDYIDSTKASAEAAGKKKGFFARAWDWFKKNILGMGTTAAGGGQDATAATKSTSTANEGKNDPVTVAIKSKTPEQQQTAKAEQAPQATTKVDLGEGKPLSVSVKQFDHPDAGKPGHIFGSSNPDHFTFREMSNVDGVQGKIVDLPNKAKIVETLAEIETRSLKKTADDMGLQYKHQRGADGSIHHEILNKDNKPLTAEQWDTFKAKSVDNFNDISKEVCKDKPFTLTKMAERQPQQQSTYQDQKAAQQTQSQQQTATASQTQDAASTPTTPKM